MNSMEISQYVGGLLHDAYPHLTADMHHPDLTVYVEVRDDAAFIHGAVEPGAGGLPVGTSGKALLLISGGIDSPVAGYMMAKRGLEIQAVHFVSPPYTSEHALEKVRTLCRKMSVYTGRVSLTVVPFTKIQEQIRDCCPEELFTVIMRRCMMRIAQQIAHETQCEALITGESLAQVASQTVQAIACTQAACQMPILRPAIGMDKDEIVKIAYRIGTFETSILPYEDCCTVFTPKHPKTKPKLEAVLEAEKAIPDLEGLLEEAVRQARQELLENEICP